MKPGDVDLDEVMRLLPRPYFRQRDIYDIAQRLGLHPSDGQTLWWVLKREKRIRRTDIAIGRGFYWERAGAVPHGRHDDHAQNSRV